MRICLFGKILLLAGVMSLLLLTGCSTVKHAANFKIHTEPEGAHIIYQQDGGSWIYLGLTPLDVVNVISEDKLKDTNTFSMRAMRCGYLDQTKEWSGDSLVREVEEKGIIFWTPRLIKNNE